MIERPARHEITLSDLRRLRLLFEDFPKNHNLVLVAQPELLTKLALAPNDDLRGRVTYSVLLRKLAPDDILAFVRAELDRAGLPHAVFTDDALALVARASAASVAVCGRFVVSPSPLGRSIDIVASGLLGRVCAEPDTSRETRGGSAPTRERVGSESVGFLGPRPVRPSVGGLRFPLGFSPLSLWNVAARVTSSRA